jgi:hypothetical protein
MSSKYRREYRGGGREEAAAVEEQSAARFQAGDEEWEIVEGSEIQKRGGAAAAMVLDDSRPISPKVEWEDPVLGNKEELIAYLKSYGLSTVNFPHWPISRSITSRDEERGCKIISDNSKGILLAIRKSPKPGSEADIREWEEALAGGDQKIIQYFRSRGRYARHFFNNPKLLAAYESLALHETKFTFNPPESPNSDDDFTFYKKVWNMSPQNTLHWAAYNGLMHVFTYLVEKHNFNPLKYDNISYDALTYAAWGGHAQMMQSLVETYGLNIDASTTSLILRNKPWFGNNEAYTEFSKKENLEKLQQEYLKKSRLIYSEGHKMAVETILDHASESLFPSAVVELVAGYMIDTNQLLAREKSKDVKLFKVGEGLLGDSLEPLRDIVTFLSKMATSIPPIFAPIVELLRTPITDKNPSAHRNALKLFAELSHLKQHSIFQLWEKINFYQETYNNKENNAFTKALDSVSQNFMDKVARVAAMLDNAGEVSSKKNPKKAKLMYNRFLQLVEQDMSILQCPWCPNQTLGQYIGRRNHCDSLLEYLDQKAFKECTKLSVSREKAIERQKKYFGEVVAYIEASDFGLEKKETLYRQYAVSKTAKYQPIGIKCGFFKSVSLSQMFLDKSAEIKSAMKIALSASVQSPS